MTDIGSTNVRAVAAPMGATTLLPLVATSIFTSAALLFWVQPMVGKMVLPLLGGSPAVWTTALLFFQTALLAGYLYAHALGTLLPVRSQIAVHVTVILLTALALPIAVPAGSIPDGEGTPTLWLAGLFMRVVGLPYIVIAATSPLLQRWFTLSGHHEARDPYYLYVASNAGSLIGLLSYPLIAEPLIGVSAQSGVWTAGYALLACLIATSGATIWMFVQSQPAPAVPQVKTRVTALDRIRWIALAFVPSSLLLGVTTHITTDIAAVPLLWAAPLALYLITFMLAFTQKPLIPRTILLKIEALAIVVLSALIWFDQQGAVGVIAHLLGFFIVATARHSALAETRPDATRLTEFYLWMSFGGALGGVFNAAVAPHIFTTVLEYPLAIVAAALTRLLLPGALAGRISRSDAALVAGAALALAAGHYALAGAGGSKLIELAIVLPLVVFAYLFNTQPMRFALAIALLLAMHQIVRPTALFEARSFFGAYRVVSADGGRYTHFLHGTTLHGAEATDPARRHEPLVYYAKSGPLGQALGAMQSTHEKLRYGLVGLGVGASSCYARPADTWTIYEIDPLVVHIARDSRHFSFLSHCTPAAHYVLGDARLSLAREPNGIYDVLVLDAFSSDSIPMHLVTREALTLARAKLAPGGVIMFNVTNRYLQLEPVVAKAARAAGLVGVAQTYSGTLKSDGEPADGSHWLALAVNPTDLLAIQSSGTWRPLTITDSAPLWTDDYSNLLGVIAFDPK